MKTKTCQNCSTINKYNNTYCTNCGLKFKENFVVPLIILNIVNFIADIMAFILFLNFEMDGSTPDFIPTLFVSSPILLLCILGFLFSCLKKKNLSIGFSIASTYLSSLSYVVVIIHIIFVISVMR